MMATKDLRVINSIDPYVWSLTYLDHRHVIVPLQLLLTRKQHENVAVICSNITWLLINLSNTHPYIQYYGHIMVTLF